jgi:hypothetical protein
MNGDHHHDCYSEYVVDDGPLLKSSASSNRSFSFFNF